MAPLIFSVATLCIVFGFLRVTADAVPINSNYTYDYGGITRAAQNKQSMAVVFTGDTFAEVV